MIMCNFAVIDRSLISRRQRRTSYDSNRSSQETIRKCFPDEGEDEEIFVDEDEMRKGKKKKSDSDDFGPPGPDGNANTVSSIFETQTRSHHPLIKIT